MKFVETIQRKQLVAVLLGLVLISAASAYLFQTVRSDSPGIDRPAWQFPLIDIDGEVHFPGQSSGCRAFAFVFMKTQCPISNRVIPELNRLYAEFSSRGIEMYAVNADANVTRPTVALHRDEFGLQLPVLLTDAARIRKDLQPTHTPQAVVIDPDGRVLYSGAVDDRHVDVGRGSRTVRREWLGEALAAIATGRPVKVAQTEPVGCLLEPIEERLQSAGVTFSQHIVPILQAHCVVCHHEGDVGPFPLDTFEDVIRHAEQIRAVVTDGTMPPWKPVGNNSHFRDDLRLSAEQIQLIETWVDVGKPFGNRDELPPPRKFPQGWRLGPPDLVLELPEAFAIPADGDDIYRYFVLPTGLETARLVAAVDFQPGNATVVHHAGFWFDKSGIARKHDRQHPGPGYSSFGGPGIPGWIGLGNWTPGTTPQRLPTGTGRMLPAGADLVLQVHYHPTGKPEQDRSRVGLYFSEPQADRLVGEIAIGDMTLSIPSGSKQHRHVAEYTLPVDTLVLDVYPHMHLLGRKIRVTAELPEGSKRELINVEDWDYAWQPRYVFRQPLRLPAGTRIVLECVYDNSTGNPYTANSSPKPVFWGEGANDEMGLVYFQVLPVRDVDYGRLTSDNLAYYNRTLQAFWKLLQQRSR